MCRNPEEVFIHRPVLSAANRGGPRLTVDRTAFDLVFSLVR